MKKILIIGIIVVALVSGGLWLLGRFGTGSNEPADSAPPMAGLARLVAEDSDSDGLKNWEEALWKTDPNNPDTDADGTSDGEEVRLGRDPLLAGPNDLFKEPETQGTGEGKEIRLEDLTLTDRFSRQFLTSFLAARSNPELSSGKVDEIFTNLALRSNEALEFQTLDPKIFKTITSSDKATRKNYGNQLAAILNSEQKLFDINELAIFEKILINNDESALAELENIESGYLRLAKAVTGLASPEDLKQIHQDLANDYLALAQVASYIQGNQTDPLAAFLALGQYRESIQSIAENYRGLIKYFSENSLTFSQEEPGFIFTKNLSYAG